MTWQPIETAPKVDRDVLLAWSGGSVLIGYWNAAWGYWDWIDSDAPSQRQPTHWQPLPQPPS